MDSFHRSGYIGHQVIELETVESTNELAATWVKNADIVEGTVIYSLNQTQGKGYLGSKWETQPGLNLAMSIILHPVFLSPDLLFFLNICSSLAVIEVLETTNTPDCTVKWPNDIYAGDNKIAGILIENNVKGAQLNSSIIGIGLNVNQEQFSGELANPTSVKLQTGISNLPGNLLLPICSQFEKHYEMLRAGHQNDLREMYVSKLYRINIPSPFQVAEQKKIGTIKGITTEGKLKIDFDGTLGSYDHKEVIYS